MHRHCEERSDEAIQNGAAALDLLRFARNDDGVKRFDLF